MVWDDSRRNAEIRYPDVCADSDEADLTTGHYLRAGPNPVLHKWCVGVGRRCTRNACPYRGKNVRRPSHHLLPCSKGHRLSVAIRPRRISTPAKVLLREVLPV